VGQRVDPPPFPRSSEPFGEDLAPVAGSPRPLGPEGATRGRVRTSRALVLHGTLFAATALTLILTGAFWEGAFVRLGSLAEVPLFVVRHPFSLLSGLPFALSVLAILAAHEMGHYLACRRYGIPATLPFFLPGIPPFGTFGAVIRIRGVIPNRKALFDVAAAGPLAGFAVALPILVWGVLRATPLSVLPSEEGFFFGASLLSTALGRLCHGDADLGVDSVYVAGWFGMLVTSMNLFPVGQLDGGHAAYTLSRRVHSLLARGTIVAMIALVAGQWILYGGIPPYTLWCVVLLLMRDRHPRLGDEVVPLDRKRRLGVALLFLIFVLSFIPLPLSL